MFKQLSSQVAIAIPQSEYQQLKEELGDRTSAEVALRQSETLFRSLTKFASVDIYFFIYLQKDVILSFTLFWGESLI